MFASAIFTGCDDYLDKAPDDRLEVNSLDKVEASLVAAYQNTRSYRFTDLSTDNATLAENIPIEYDITEDLYTWSRNFRDQEHQDAPSEYWRATYKSIANANLALESLEKVSVDDNLNAKVMALRGEALVMRAYCHFMLVNLFAKHYDKETAASDLGIPYVTKIENKLEVNYIRESVQEVYNKIEKDLELGLSLMKEGDANINKYRFTIQTAYAFAARFYTFRNANDEDVIKALAFARLAIEKFGGTKVMRFWNDYYSDANGPVDIEKQEVGMPQASYTWTSSNFKYGMTLDTKAILDQNPFSLSDARINNGYKRSGNGWTSVGAFIYVKGKNGMTATDIFPLAEVVLNAAEALVRQKDFANAKLMFDAIGEISYRGYDDKSLTSEKLQNFYKGESEQDNWIQHLLFERRKMFLSKGLRWFDLKRYEIDVEHKLKDGTVIKLSEIAPNKDYQIPSYAIGSGMTANK